jgi:hypothetical protein
VVLVEQQPSSSGNSTAVSNSTTAVKNLSVVTLRHPTSIQADSYDYTKDVSSSSAYLCSYRYKLCITMWTCKVPLTAKLDHITNAAEQVQQFC